LRGLHRAHLRSISYENIDVQLGHKLTLDVDRMYEKIVEQGRGGWCYEMNALFAWALRELDFNVEYLSSGVNANVLGASAMKGHLILRVHLDRPHLADVGFGNGFYLPLPLSEGEHTDGIFKYRLERVDNVWRYHNPPQIGGTYDFTEQPYELQDFAEKCLWQQTSPESKFVQNLVCHRHTDEGIITLRGAVLQIYTRLGEHEEIAQSQAQFAQMLDEHFSLRPPEMDELWERVAERHRAWVRQKMRGY
jgi:N-hydroxyarylamine O-acetyltransferase